MAQTVRPVMLVILDGFGWRQETADNAVRLARMPNFTRLWQSSPHAFLRTSGRDVGLPDGQMGNSEVGHLNIGAGRVVHQELVRIGDAIADRSIAKVPAFTALIGKLKASGGTCHLMGLLSPGGVHAHEDHAVALAKLLHAAEVPATMHAFPTAETLPRNPPRTTSPGSPPRCRRACTSAPSVAATTRWTETNAGTA
jgi:2,3-bisphosphoglycerate-independent phosphoglycerate mutase